MALSPPGKSSAKRIATRRQVKARDRRALVLSRLSSAVSNTSSTPPTATLTSPLIVLPRSSYRRQRIRSKRLNGIHLEDSHPHIWLTEDNLDLLFRDVMQCLLDQSHAIQEISVYNILTAFTERDIQALYCVISRMPHLKLFNVWASSPMTVSTVASIMQQAPGLTSLGLGNLMISNANDLLLLAQQVYDHPSLKKLTLENLLVFQNDDRGERFALDALLRAVSANPRMECLQVSVAVAVSPPSSERSDTSTLAHDSATILHPETLVGLCRRLKKLRLSRVGLSSRHIQAMIQALAHSSPNTALTSLSLHHCGCKGKELVALHDAMVNVLESNIHLEFISLDSLPNTAMDVNHYYDYHHQQQQAWKMKSLLHWNKSGVREALFPNSNARRSDWVDALAEHGGDDLNALNYLLHAAVPTLFVTNP